MTLATELAKEGQRVEYFVTLEGAGWPVNGLSGSLSGGFAGVVWATADMESTLAATLGCTVYGGLGLPESISESVDPLSATYSPSGLSFSIIDHDDWWLTNMVPRKAGNETTLGAGLYPELQTIRLNDGTAFAENGLAWIGGRELVKLGVKALVGGTVYDYTGSTRGYLGTQQGSSLRQIQNFCLGYWPITLTSVSDVSRWWWNRKVALWAHVPGEGVANVELLWYGKLRNIDNPSAGIVWNLSCAGDFLSCYSRIHRAVDWKVSTYYYNGAAVTYNGDRSVSSEVAAQGGRRYCVFSKNVAAAWDGLGNDNSGGMYELAAAYHYRCEPGGLAGMVTTWGTGDTQALDLDTDENILRSFVMIEDAVYFMHKRSNITGATANYKVLADLIPYAGADPMANATRNPGGSIGSVDLPLYGMNAKARFLLSNYGNDKETSRFCVNGKTTRRVIDTLLIFMLSSDREFYISDTAAGSTATVINFANSGAAADKWIGKALFSVEGATKWEARPITDNDATTITVGGGGFSAAPAAGVEMQVRNSIYDVLPVGWGLGIPATDVDLDSFEDIQRDHLSDCNLGEFIIGTEDEVDIWKLLTDNILKPYGILVYFDYETRKISARYVGVPAEANVFETYTAIGAGDIIDPGELRHTFTNPIGSIRLKVRRSTERITSLSPISSTSAATPHTGGRQ